MGAGWLVVDGRVVVGWPVVVWVVWRGLLFPFFGRVLRNIVLGRGYIGHSFRSVGEKKAPNGTA